MSSRRDQAKGLIPFAVKLDSELVNKIRNLAEEHNAELNETVADLLHKGLERSDPPQK